MNPITLAEIERIGNWLAELCWDDEQLFADMTEAESPAQFVVERLHQERASALELIEGIKAREADLKARKERLVHREITLKAAIGKVLRAARLAKIELPEATYSVRDGRAKLAIVDPDAVPDTFKVPAFTIDKRLVNDAYSDSDQLPNWLVRTDAQDVVMSRAK